MKLWAVLFLLVLSGCASSESEEEDIIGSKPSHPVIGQWQLEPGQDGIFDRTPSEPVAGESAKDAHFRELLNDMMKHVYVPNFADNAFLEFGRSGVFHCEGISFEGVAWPPEGKYWFPDQNRENELGVYDAGPNEGMWTNDWDNPNESSLQRVPIICAEFRLEGDKLVWALPWLPPGGTAGFNFTMELFLIRRQPETRSDDSVFGELLEEADGNLEK